MSVLRRRVVVTGIGVVTPLGNDNRSFWNHITEGKSGIDTIRSFDVSQYATKIAGQVKDFDPDEHMERKHWRKMDRFAQFSIAAGCRAIADSGLVIGKDVAYSRAGVCIGSGIGGLETWEHQHCVLVQKGPQRVSPFFIPMMISNMASGQMSIIWGCTGPTLNVVTACATGTNSIGEAYKFILNDQVDAMLCGGAEAPISPMGLAGFGAMRAMSTRNDDPERASRPFDKKRDGFVIGEGAGVLMLESLASAERRGAPIYAEIIGYGLTSDAYHMTDPNPQGASRCMDLALKNARIQPQDVDYINAHGTGTIAGDRSETTAIKTTFGDHSRKLAISSTKSMTGHMLGASGGVEAAICCLALSHQTLVPTINLTDPDAECDLDYIPNVSRTANINIALSNSFGFGGHNATLVFAKFGGGS